MNFFSTFFSFFQNMKLKFKLLCIYLLALTISLLLLFIVLKATMGQQLFSHEKSALNHSLNQSITQLDSKINDIINLSNIICNNDDILSAYNVDYKNDYFRMYTAYVNDIMSDLYTYQFLVPEVTSIKIYTSCGLIPYKDLTEDIDTLKKQPWFTEIKDNYQLQWITSEKEGKPCLAALCKLTQNPSYPFENYLYLEMDYNKFFSSTSSVNQNSYGLVIKGKDNSLLYHYNSYPNGDVPITLKEILTDYEKVKDKYENEYIFLSAPVESTGWMVYYFSPINRIKAAVNQTIMITFILIALCFILLFFMTFFTVNTLLFPLRQLANMIQKISLENLGNSEILLVSQRQDEIGTLTNAFNSMLKRIHLLIDEVYVQKLKSKEYQLKALRAQINPHFLYNTLSLISARAIIAGQTEISDTIKLLTTFYWTSLNNGDDVTTIRNELENIRAYISIQLILTGNAFGVVYDVDDSLLDIIMPSFILQPLVENAIEHGLLNSRKKEKELIISIFFSDPYCCIRIRDNGVGIPKNKLDKLFSHETDHIGIKNVNERLKLFYGEDMGLRITSTPNIGTDVTIWIPGSSTRK